MSKNINKLQALKIIFYFFTALVILVGSLAALFNTALDKGLKTGIYILFGLILFNFTYLMAGKGAKKSFIMAFILSIITALYLRFL